MTHTLSIEAATASANAGLTNARAYRGAGLGAGPTDFLTGVPSGTFGAGALGVNKAEGSALGAEESTKNIAVRWQTVFAEEVTSNGPVEQAAASSEGSSAGLRGMGAGIPAPQNVSQTAVPLVLSETFAAAGKSAVSPSAERLARRMNESSENKSGSNIHRATAGESQIELSAVHLPQPLLTISDEPVLRYGLQNGLQFAMPPAVKISADSVSPTTVSGHPSNIFSASSGDMESAAGRTFSGAAIQRKSGDIVSGALLGTSSTEGASGKGTSELFAERSLLSASEMRTAVNVLRSSSLSVSQLLAPHEKSIEATQGLSHPTSIPASVPDAIRSTLQSTNQPSATPRFGNALPTKSGLPTSTEAKLQHVGPEGQVNSSLNISPRADSEQPFMGINLAHLQKNSSETESPNSSGKLEPRKSRKGTAESSSLSSKGETTASPQISQSTQSSAKPSPENLLNESTAASAQRTVFSSAAPSQAPTSGSPSLSGGTGHASNPLANPFAAMDTPSIGGLSSGDQMTGVQASWSRAASHQVEAGYHDPTLGWVEVRASQETDGVHATLIPSSTGAADSLGLHLPGMQSYLAERHTPVESLTMGVGRTVEAIAGTGQEEESGSGLSQSPGQSPGQSHGQSAAQMPDPTSDGSQQNGGAGNSRRQTDGRVPEPHGANSPALHSPAQDSPTQDSLAQDPRGTGRVAATLEAATAADSYLQPARGPELIGQVLTVGAGSMASGINASSQRPGERGQRISLLA